MLTFKELMAQRYIDEALHKDLQSVLDSNIKPDTKLRQFRKTKKALQNSGEVTGLTPEPSREGSSRSVVFGNEPKSIMLNGKPFNVPTVTKIAKPQRLDRYTGNVRNANNQETSTRHALLGNYQNLAESNERTQKNYGIYRETSPGNWEINPHGVVIPVMDKHKSPNGIPDWVEMARADNITKKRFRELTKHPTHPEGLDFDKFHDTLLHEYAASKGERRFQAPLATEEEREKIYEHPFFMHTEDFIHNTGTHPADLRLQNIGHMKGDADHPEGHLGFLDIGFARTKHPETNADINIPEVHTQARRKMHFG